MPTPFASSAVPEQLDRLWHLDASRVAAISGCEVLSADKLTKASFDEYLPFDLVPIFGMDGDWICLRMGPAGEVEECVFYRHDDWGDCLPFGGDLGEALLLRGADPRGEREWCPELVEMASSIGLSCSIASEAALATSSKELACVLLEHGIGVESMGKPGCWEVDGLRRQLVDACFCKFYRLETQVPDPLRFWYSLEGLPGAVETIFLQREYEGHRREPDFEAMASAAGRVVAKRNDVGWAWVLLADVAGYRDDLDTAARCVERAASCLERTFDFYGGHYLCGVERKLRQGPSRLDFDDPLVSTLLSKGDRASRNRASRYWLEVAEKSVQKEDWMTAWQAWYRHAFHWQASDRDLIGVAIQLLDVAKKGDFVGWQRLLDWRFG
jgi:hypothetical protein